MIHPHTVLRLVDETIGLGVFATVPLPRGTIVWVRDPLDIVLTLERMTALPAMVRESFLHFAFRDQRGHYVLCWDHARYVNHSFSPNTMITPFHFDVAIRDIAAGEELRGDYGCLNIIEAFVPHPEPGGREVVRGDDLRHQHHVWDRLLAEALPDLVRVDQPMRNLIDDQLWEQVRNIAEGHGPMPTVRDCLLDGQGGC